MNTTATTNPFHRETPRRETPVRIGCTYVPARRVPTARSAAVSLKFGLHADADASHILDPFQLRLAPGRIVLIVGPSGSGKSTALRQVGAQCAGGQCVDRVGFPRNLSLVDAICPNEPLPKALELMSACGLGEARLWLRAYDELSDGQRFRARLARAIGRHIRHRSPAPLICDEFASCIHRRLGRAIAFNLRKLASRYGLSLVLSCCDDELRRDLQPDVTVSLNGQGHSHVTEQTPRRSAISLWRRLRVERGRKRDYEAFQAMHYRTSDELGFVDKVFVLREPASGEALGIVVYSHGPLELHLRNQATGGRFVRNPRRLNREVRILRRLVIHPDVRGCGLGHRLVRKTLPLVGTRFVECLAAMGEVNPVFERAGMTRIGTCAMPPDRARILEELRRLDVDPFGRDFVVQVCRRPRVRRLVAGLVYQWYQATTAGGEKRVARQSPELIAQTFRGLIGSRPVYFLWERQTRKKKKAASGRGKRANGPRPRGSKE